MEKKGVVSSEDSALAVKAAGENPENAAKEYDRDEEAIRVAERAHAAFVKRELRRNSNLVSCAREQ